MQSDRLSKYVTLYVLTVVVDPSLFEHNFDKYGLILIIFSLLQTEINCDKVYHKIYQSVSLT